MKLSILLSSLALGGVLVAGGLWLAPSVAGESRPAPAAERQWLSIPQVHAKLEAAGYRNIEKIERERGGYEVRATDRSGERIKLYVNAQSGEIDQRDQRHRHDRQARSDGDGSPHGAADCNKRRCRDDLPASPSPSASSNSLPIK